MRKITTIILSFIMILSLVACGNTKKVESGLKDGQYKSIQDGHNGKIEVSLEVKNGKAEKAEIIKQDETPGLGTEAIEKIVKQFNEDKSLNLDDVTGATVSSKAVKNGLKDLMKQAGATEEMLKTSEKKTERKIKDSYECDVVIIGAGGAGLSAAIEAAENGAKVIVIEKASLAGGNTLVSGGGINVAGSKHQKDRNIEDSAQKFYEDTLKAGDNMADPKLVKVMADNSLDAANWLINDIHVEFMEDRLQQFGGHSVPRALVPVGNKGTELINKLLKKAEKLNVEVLYDTPAVEIFEEKGAATGIKAKNGNKDINIKANKGVIIASGGFASNVEMRKKYNKNYDERFKTTATQFSTGDGIVMAEKLGAKLRDMDYIQVYPTCNPKTGIISYVANSRFDGAILVNQKGERFVNEMGRRDEISNAILKQDDSVAYLVWGNEIESVGKMTEIHKKEFEKMESEDLIYSSDNLEDLSKHFNINVENFTKTINKFNSYVEKETDPDFDKTGAFKPIKTGKFYIQKIAPSTHHTMGGIVINEKAQVINKDGKVIKNLYAAGEVVGGIHGTNRLGGNAITDIIVFGRIAGKEITK